MRKLIILLFLSPMIMFAQTIGLKELWQQAVENNATLGQLKIRQDITEIQFNTKTNAFYPKLTAKGSYNYISEKSSISFGAFSKSIGTNDKTDFSLQIQQPVFTGFRLTEEKNNAKTDKNISTIEYRATRDQLFLQIGMIYYRICALDSQIRIINSSKDRLQRQKEKVLSLWKNKMAIAQDTLDIDNKILELETQKLETENQITVQKAQLCRLIGKDLPGDLSLSYQPQPLPDNMDSRLKTALAKRNELQLLKMEEQKLKGQKRIAQSLYYPQVYAQAEYHYANPGVQMSSEWGDYYALGLGFNLNIWDWSETKDKNKTVSLAMKQNKIKNNDMILSIEQEYRQLCANLSTIEKQLVLADKIIEQENLRLNLIKTKYEQSQVTVTDVLDIESKVTEAQIKKEMQLLNQNTQLLNLDAFSGTIGE